MSHIFREQLEALLNKRIQESADEFKTELAQLNRQKDKLLRRQEKLLEAHFADAIPLNLLKTKQDEITKALLDIDDQIAAHDTHYEIISDRLKQALDLIEDCVSAYRNAPDQIKRAFNQAIFEKILVYNDGEISAEFNEPFDILLDLGNSRFIYTNADKTSQKKASSNTPKKEENLDQNYFFDQGFGKKLLCRDDNIG